MANTLTMRAPAIARLHPTGGTRWLATGLGFYALVGGFMSFLGWALDLRRLTDWDNDGISIQPNTTIGLMTAGLGLMLLAARGGRLVALAGVATGLIGATVLFETLTGIDLGIDSLLMFDRPWGQWTTVVPGRMGPPGATSFTLLGLGLLLAIRGPKSRQAASVLALFVAWIGTFSAVGYFFGANRLYSLPQLTAIAFQTTTMILAVAIGLVAALPDCQPTRVLLENSTAGLLARRALPAIVLLPIAIGWLRIRGQKMGLYDTGSGTALLVLALIVLLCMVLWWGVKAVSGREAALAAMNESRLRADMVLGAARDQFVVLDGDGRYTYVNDRVLEISGLSREQLLGRTLLELWPAAAGSPLEAAVRRAMDERVTESLEYYDVSRDRWFDIRIHPTGEGGVALFVLEITKRKRAEAGLLESEQRLKLADRRKDEFLATMAHELRNPLAPIRNAVGILKAEGPPDRELVWACEVIDRQVGQMARLIDDLLDVARITQNRVELRRQPMTIAEIVQHSLETSRPLIDAAGHQLVVTLATEELWIDADPIRISQVVANLLNNSAKYTRPGGRITLTVTREGSDVLLSVEDTGIGISAEHLPNVFEMFTPLTPANEHAPGGLGVGLSIVRGIVEAHGGKVEAYSDGVDLGSRFVVRLPGVAVPESVGRTTAALEASGTALAPLRIVVADDNKDSAESLVIALEIAGHNATLARDGLEAVEAAERVRPDVVLLDIGMPRLNGYDAARRIREQEWGKAPLLVAITGWGQQEDRERAAAAGFDFHLVKPVELPKLVELLRGRRLTEAGQDGAPAP